MSRAHSRRLVRLLAAAAALGLAAAAGAAAAQSCAAQGPDATRCRFLLPQAGGVQVLARVYLHRTGGHPAADLQVSVDGRPCFRRLEHPGLLNGAAVGTCRLRLGAAEHWIEAQATARDAEAAGVGVEMTADEAPLVMNSPPKRHRWRLPF